MRHGADRGWSHKGWQGLGRVRQESGDLDGLDDDRVNRAIHPTGAHGGDLVDDLAGLLVGNLTEDGVPTVEVWGRGDGDEEL